MFDADQDAYVALRGILKEGTSRVIVWTGAGVSRAAKLPTWEGLRVALTEIARRKAGTFDAAGTAQASSRVEAIEKETNPWVAFDRLKSFLGQQTFRDSIRDALIPAATTPVPTVLTKIWALPIVGIYTLNLDRLAGRALSLSYPGTNILELSGMELARAPYILSGNQRIVANLHGTYDDTASWVFTHTDLNSLLKREAYKSLLRSTFSLYCNVFVGMSVEDRAVGGQLQKFSTMSEGPSNFWITDRNDMETDEWAERSNTRVIRYKTPNGDHAQLIQLLDDLRSFQPIEPPDAPPVIPAIVSTSADDLPTAEDLAREDAGTIRLLLNSHAAKLLDDGTDEAYEEYSQFSSEYDMAIYRAWYVNPKGDDLLGYHIEYEAERGAFGKVYKGIDSNGGSVAIKILLEEIRRNPDLVKSFRRGVRSMRILQDRGVQGMVKYLSASEIPAFVAMEWIDGANLKNAKESRSLDSWKEILRIAFALTQIILAAHRLPERVLHRDIRPSNIMLRDFWTSPEDCEVIVLDFDLSYHRGAQERSVLHSTAAGYLAPEQLIAIRGESTRHAAVDSFGLGMTLYFLGTGTEPLPGIHTSAKWSDSIDNGLRSMQPSNWMCVPARYGRLIKACTEDRQVARSDLSQVVDELSVLIAAEAGQALAFSAEFLAEEMAARSSSFQAYVWDPNWNRARRSSPTGLELELTGDEIARKVRLTIRWGYTGVRDWSKIAKYVVRARSEATARLKESGWTIESSSSSTASLLLEASADQQVLLESLDGLASGIDAALEKINQLA